MGANCALKQVRLSVCCSICSPTVALHDFQGLPCSRLWVLTMPTQATFALCICVCLSLNVVNCAISFSNPNDRPGGRFDVSYSFPGARRVRLQLHSAFSD